MMLESRHGQRITRHSATDETADKRPVVATVAGVAQRHIALGGKSPRTSGPHLSPASTAATALGFMIPGDRVARTFHGNGTE
jgi:hypothetical protein